MKRICLLRICLCLIAGFLLASRIPAGAQTLPLLDMAVAPFMQTAFPGDTLFWNVQLTNNTTETAYFLLTDFSDGLPIVPDVTVPPYNTAGFAANYTLLPTETLTLTNLYQTEVSPTAAPAVYDAPAVMTYTLFDDATFANVLIDGLTAAGDWRLIVQAPSQVPEPGSAAVLVGLSVSGAGFLFRYCRRAGKTV